jgi:hypothetical protein
MEQELQSGSLKSYQWEFSLIHGTALLITLSLLFIFLFLGYLDYKAFYHFCEPLQRILFTFAQEEVLNLSSGS